MLIVIVGVGQVGKTTTGRILAQKLNYKFLDLDEIICREYKSIENFQSMCGTRENRYREKTNIVLNYCLNQDNLVFVVSPIYSKEENIRLKSTLTNAKFINLVASPNSIYERIGYYDENMHLLENSDEYKESHRAKIIMGIVNDNLANQYEFSIYDQFDTSNLSAEESAEMIIKNITNNMDFQE